MSEEAFIRGEVSKIRREIDWKTHCESAFNECFDNKLNYLVLLYQFNFEAVALHLINEFPQYEYKINRKFIGYRWFQMHREEKQRIRKQQKQRQGQRGQEQNAIEKERAKLWYYYDQPMKNSAQKLQKALRKAQDLDDSQTQGFILYKPRFSAQRQFALEREQFQNEKIEQIMSNSYAFDFGLFGQNPQQKQSEQEEQQLYFQEEKKYLKSGEILYEDKTKDNSKEQYEGYDQFEVYVPSYIAAKEMREQKEQIELREQYCFEVEDYDSD